MKTADVMAVQQMTAFTGGKQDILREVVMKYIDHFYPKWVYRQSQHTNTRQIDHHYYIVYLLLDIIIYH